MDTTEAVSRPLAIRVAVTLYSAKVLQDPILGPRFAGHDPRLVAAYNRGFVNAALGCADQFSGQRLDTPGKPFRLSASEFDIAIELLASSLCEAGIPNELAAQLTQRLEPVRRQMVA